MNEPLTPEAIEALTAGYVIGNLDRHEVVWIIRDIRIVRN